MNFREFQTQERKRMYEKYGFKGSTKLTPNLSGYNLFDYMVEYAERYKKLFPEVRHKRELKCPFCNFETEKQNIKGMEKHQKVRHSPSQFFY